MANCSRCRKPTKEYSRWEKDGMTHTKYVCPSCGRSHTFIMPAAKHLRKHLRKGKFDGEGELYERIHGHKNQRFRPFEPAEPTAEQRARDDIFREIFGIKPEPKNEAPADPLYPVGEFPSTSFVRDFLICTNRDILNFKIESNPGAGFWQITFWNPRFTDECTTAVMLHSEPEAMKKAGVDHEKELRARMEYATETLPVV